jgi:heme oxygenase (biliverdin-producing, ferredoxin)
MTTETNTKFSEDIRAASWALHQSAEGSHFMSDLLAGEISRERYAHYVGQLYHVYSVIEEAAKAMRNDPIAGPFVQDELTRLPAIAADLQYFFGADYDGPLDPTDGTREYCDRLREACFAWSGGFVAHHYTRYMGDLSGGQYIGKVVEKTYELENHDGARFYVFEKIADPKTFKNEYRHRLDTSPWTPEEKQRIIDEVLLAYRLNNRLLAALD